MQQIFLSTFFSFGLFHFSQLWNEWHLLPLCGLFLCHGLHVFVVHERVEAGIERGDGVDALLAGDVSLVWHLLAGTLVGGHLADDRRHLESFSNSFQSATKKDITKKQFRGLREVAVEGAVAGPSFLLSRVKENVKTWNTRNNCYNKISKLMIISPHLNPPNENF